jgi:hypothetical protein
MEYSAMHLRGEIRGRRRRRKPADAWEVLLKIVCQMIPAKILVGLS